MLSISAMVQMGPWICTGIDVNVARDEKCERCGRWIRYVWKMELQLPAPKRHWRIGSECGPLLEHLSDELWSGATTQLVRRQNLVMRFDVIFAEWRQQPSHAAFRGVDLKFYQDKFKLVTEGTPTKEQLDHIGGFTQGMLKKLGKPKMP
jgi:hypothetical protein